MSATDFLSSALSATSRALSGGEIITINSAAVPAIADPDTEEEDLMLGGSGDHRTCTVLVASRDLDGLPVKGDTVTFRNQDWRINQIEHHPLTTTRLTLHSPARRT